MKCYSLRSLTMAAALGLIMAQTGCRHIGPGTVPGDRADYSTSILESWKRQTLLNIVRLRYLDPPIFVDVGQIVAGYSMETAFTAGGSLPQNGNFGGNTAALGGSAKYTDRPTITYMPLTGNRFVKSLMTPLPPESIFFTIQSGWPADGVLFATLASINGLNNQGTSINGITVPDTNFLRVLTLMRNIQVSGAVGMRVEQDSAKQQTTLLTFRSKDISPKTAAESRELRRLLKLDPNAEDFKLVFGATAQNDREVAVVTRSLLQLMATMSSQADVPAADVSQGRTVPGWESLTNQPSAIRLIQIHSAPSKPADAFVTVNYHNQWFWISDCDLKSKRVFSFMMMLFTLADNGEKESLPLITIPAQ